MTLKLGCKFDLSVRCFLENILSIFEEFIGFCFALRKRWDFLKKWQKEERAKIGICED